MSHPEGSKRKEAGFELRAPPASTLSSQIRFDPRKSLDPETKYQTSLDCHQAAASRTWSAQTRQRRMPKTAAAPLSQCTIARLSRTLQLVESEKKKRLRLRVYLKNGTKTEDGGDHWLPDDADERIAHLYAKLKITEAELTSDFIAKLLAWPRKVGDSTVSEAAGGKAAGDETEAACETETDRDPSCGDAAGGTPDDTGANAEEYHGPSSSSRGGHGDKQDDGAGFELPATQEADADDTAESRPSSPVGFDLDAACHLCDDGECTAAFDLPGGKFCCASCLEDSTNGDEISAAAEAQFAARVAAAAHAPPMPPTFETRRSARTIKPVAQIYDLERGGKGQPGWSGYDLQRLGARHDRTREESYSELQAARDRLREEFEAAQHENSELAGRLDSVFGQLRELCRPRGEELELADCEAAAAVLLRETIAELTDAWERDRRDSTVDSTDAVDTAAPPANGVNVPSDAAAFQIEPWSVEGPVRMGGVNSG